MSKTLMYISEEWRAVAVLQIIHFTYHIHNFCNYSNFYIYLYVVRIYITTHKTEHWNTIFLFFKSYILSDTSTHSHTESHIFLTVFFFSLSKECGGLTPVPSQLFLLSWISMTYTYFLLKLLFFWMKWCLKCRFKDLLCYSWGCHKVAKLISILNSLHKEDGENTVSHSDDLISQSQIYSF